MKTDSTTGAGILFFVMALLLATPFVSAADSIDVIKYSVSYDFFTGAETGQPALCACGDMIDRVVVQNTGSFGAVFTISTDSKYASIFEQEFSLEPGESKTVDIFLKADCGAKAGVYAYNVFVQNNLGRERVIQRELSINSCQTINAALYTNKAEIKPCQPVKYSIELENPSTFDEKYVITADTYQDFFNFSRGEILVAAGKKVVVENELSLSCDISGVVPVRFTINAVNSGLSTQLAHDLNVEWDYAFLESIPETVDACFEEYGESEFVIKNEGSVENNYAINLRNAPDFVVVEPVEFSLKSGDSQTVKFKFSPWNIKAKEYNFVTVVTSELGGTTVEKNVKLGVNPCYDVKVNIVSDENPTVCLGDNYFDVSLKNDGLFGENVKLELSGPEYASIEPDVLKVSKDSEEYVKIKINAPWKETQFYEDEFTITASLPDRLTEKTWSDSFKVTVMDDYACTLAEFSRHRIYARYTAGEAYVRAHNNGVRLSEYSVSLEGSEFLSLTENSFYLEPGQLKDIPIKLYSDDSEVQEKYYFNLTLKSDNGQEYTRQYELVMTQTPFWEEAYAYATADSCRIVGSILVILLVIALIVFIAMHFRPNRVLSRNIWFKAGMIVAIVLVVVLAFAIFGWPKSGYQPLPESDDNYSVVWYEDHSMYVDMSVFFKDPDNDALTYSVVDGAENIDISFSGNYAVLRPDKDFEGSRRVRFEAADPEGESVQSPRITLVVVDTPEYSFEDYHKMYCGYINAALLVLLLLVILFTPFGTRSGRIKKLAFERPPKMPRVPKAPGSRRSRKRKK